MRRNFYFTNHYGVIRGTLIPVLAVALFGLFVCITIVNTFITSKEYRAQIIEQDIKKLVEIFKKIDQECRILAFAQDKNVINFLNTQSFAGSQIGPMNLKHPERWQGKYLDDNPSIQGKEYMVVKTKKGYFVTPGDGVTLPNGSVIGVDIKVDENADIGAMLKDEKKFLYKGRALASSLDIKKRGDFFKVLLPPVSADF